jgi:hypothetical protein
MLILRVISLSQVNPGYRTPNDDALLLQLDLLHAMKLLSCPTFAYPKEA